MEDWREEQEREIPPTDALKKSIRSKLSIKLIEGDSSEMLLLSTILRQSCRYWCWVSITARYLQEYLCVLGY